IAFNGDTNSAGGAGGILISNTTTALGNSLFSNKGKGISSGISGPVLTGATRTSIVGTFFSRANTTSRLEFFATPDTGPFSNAQGKTFLGTMDATTDDEGRASFTFPPPGGVPAGQFLTATATNTFGTTDFSRSISITAATSADLGVTVTDAPDPVAAGG